MKLVHYRRPFRCACGTSPLVIRLALTIIVVCGAIVVRVVVASVRVGVVVARSLYTYTSQNAHRSYSYQ